MIRLNMMKLATVLFTLFLVFSSLSAEAARRLGGGGAHRGRDGGVRPPGHPQRQGGQPCLDRVRRVHVVPQSRVAAGNVIVKPRNT